MKQLNWFQEKLGISNYAIAWIGFLKGLILGLLIYHFFICHYEIQPSLLGKTCTLTQIVYVLLVIVSLADLPMPYWAVEYGLWVVTIITSLSGVHYYIVWGIKAYRQRQANV